MREEILAEVNAERDRQDSFWGHSFDDVNNPNDWVAYITRYVSDGAYSGRTQKYSHKDFREALIKTAALCVAAVESYERQKKFPSRHYDK